MCTRYTACSAHSGVARGTAAKLLMYGEKQFNSAGGGNVLLAGLPTRRIKRKKKAQKSGLESLGETEKQEKLTHTPAKKEKGNIRRFTMSYQQGEFGLRRCSKKDKVSRHHRCCQEPKNEVFGGKHQKPEKNSW